MSLIFSLIIVVGKFIDGQYSSIGLVEDTKPTRNLFRITNYYELLRIIKIFTRNFRPTAVTASARPAAARAMRLETRILVTLRIYIINNNIFAVYGI